MKISIFLLIIVIVVGGGAFAYYHYSREATLDERMMASVRATEEKALALKQQREADAEAQKNLWEQRAAIEAARVARQQAVDTAERQRQDALRKAPEIINAFVRVWNAPGRDPIIPVALGEPKYLTAIVDALMSGNMRYGEPLHRLDQNTYLDQETVLAAVKLVVSNPKEFVYSHGEILLLEDYQAQVEHAKRQEDHDHAIALEAEVLKASAASAPIPVDPPAQ